MMNKGDNLKRIVIKDLVTETLHANVKVNRVIPIENIIHITKEDDEIEFEYANKLHYSSKETIDSHTREVS